MSNGGGASKTPEELAVDQRRAEANKWKRIYKGTQFTKKVLTGIVASAAAFATFHFATIDSADKPYKPGSDRWTVKTSIVEDEEREIGMSDLVKLELLPKVVKKDFEDKRIDLESSQGYREGMMVETVGYIHYAHRDANDSDYHVQMNDKATNSLTDQKSCVIVEVPHPQAALDNNDEVLAQLLTDARKFIRDNCFHGKEPGGKVEPPLRVEVVGQLFYDLHHAPTKAGGDPGGGRGKALDKGAPRMMATTIWEIHPVTGFKLAPLQP